MDKAIVATLQQSGFSEKEALVYAALLELGQGDVSDIAKAAGIGRANIYVILDKLTEEGYVSPIPNKTVKHYAAAPPIKILNHLQNNATMFKQMLPILQASFSRPGGKPRMHYFEGKQAVLNVFREINHFPEGLFITSIARMQELYPEEVEFWRNSFVQKSIPLHTRDLLPDTPTDRRFAKDTNNDQHQARFLPKGTEIGMDFALYGKQVAITSLTDTPFSVVIQSEELYNSLRAIFELLWLQARRLSL